MKFNNRENIPHLTTEDKIIWESRSVAVNGVIMLFYKYDMYVLVSKRGKKAADQIGKMNLVAGYLDWDENGTQALFREAWEECGIDLNIILKECIIKGNYLNNPWHVNTEPDENRQNVSLRYGLYAESYKLYDLTTKYNEVEGEVEDPQWLNVEDVNKHEWAFGHDKIIYDFIKLQLFNESKEK